ncbi:radical SAM superfamily protein [Candidatus Methanoplasma termitum]|uniref:Radical SAM superfamily protein n=1 Tax=Candidatus Methanoplasma termitum TaxID=1577791 RepID=A0A0A7LIB1_9ARCH|nr:radical SAM protein [Candidatus Methanoplasma termitum]AIZ57241.1 radical SAM superfamily protein [Candidatus Methanoplasma termitum]
MKIYDYGSASNCPLPEGCKHCVNGSKMVLFITGKCGTDCFYCPVSPEKKGKDVIFANERRISELSEMLEEAESMDAAGTGITGGDPLSNMDRTITAIKMLKEHFGSEHHIHLYTSMIDLDKAKKLCDAGLDEIRFHPPMSQWETMSFDVVSKIISDTSLDVGMEVPAIPGNEEKLEKVVVAAAKAGIGCININEFEFSESNWNMMEDLGFRVKDDLSSAVAGSEEMTIALMKKYPEIPIHFCSSTFKDGVQLRNRFIRRANVIAKEYDVITEDGTILKGVVYADDLREAAEALIRLRVPKDLMFVDEERNRIEVASWKLKKIAKKLPYKSYIVEEYPTFDRMEVERMPLGHE